MRLRYLIGASVIALIIGGGIWLYSSSSEQMATGEGGLPLIRASTDPIKMAPTEPGGEVMPHADSTVFSAISSAQDVDPSMTGGQLPGEGAAVEPPMDFAGLRTGFALAPEPETKIESLFTEEEKKAAAEAALNEKKFGSQSQYYTGMAHDPGAVIAPITQENETEPSSGSEPAPVAEEETRKDITGPVAEPAVAPHTEASTDPDQAQADIVESLQTESAAPAPATLPPISTEGAGEAAQAMEAEEKAMMVRPAIKPQPPLEKVEKPKEVVEEEIVAEAAPAPLEKETVAEAHPVRETKPASKPVEAKPGKPEPVQEMQVVPIAPRPSVGMKPVVEEGPAPSPKATSAAPAQSSEGGYVIQLSSTPNQADAERSWLQMQSMHPEALRGLTPSYKTAEVPGVGQMVRLRAGVISREEANARCDAIRRENPRGGCLVLRN